MKATQVEYYISDEDSITKSTNDLIKVPLNKGNHDLIAGISY